jgi:hypothetical protein
MSVMLLLAACGDPASDSPASTTAPAVVREWPEDLRVTGAAASGPDLVLLAVSSDEPLAARQQVLRRTAAGEVTELPDLPTQGTFRIATAGPTVVVGGVSCGERPVCDEGPVVLYRLRGDASGWDQLYLSDAPISSEVEMSAGRGRSDHGSVMVDDQLFVVGPDGSLVVGPEDAARRELPRLEAPGVGDGTQMFFCDLGDRQVAIPATSEPMEGVSGIDPVDTVAGSVWQLRLDRLEAGWVQVAEAPEGLSNLGAVAECGGSTMTIHADGTEHTFDADTLTWTARPGSFEQLHGSSVFSLRQPGEIAVAPDGLTVFAVTGDRVIVRPDGGPWTDIGQTASAVYSTETGVVAIAGTADGITFTDLEW